MKREEDTERPPITEAMVNTATDEWLKSVHINPKFLSKTDIEMEFLMAQREAEVLLRGFRDYLTDKQSYHLVSFLKRLRIRKLREKMSISAAYNVLNIAAKVKRKCFVDYRALGKQNKINHL